MNRKLVVAMSLLGLVSCPVLAATSTTTTTTTNNQTTNTAVMATANNTSMQSDGKAASVATKPRHHRRHRMVRHHEEREVAEHDFKDYKGYKDMVPVCTITPTAITMIEMTQNVGRALPNPCNPGWFDRISVSGGVNVDMGHFGNRNANYMGENYNLISLNDAYINVSAIAADWARAFASISYNTATIMNNNGFPTVYKTWGASEYDAAYSNNIAGSNNNAVQLEQAYATLGNFDVSPIFVQVGKQFQDYGRFDIHAITVPMTQVLSEVLATSLKVGFIANGFNGSVYTFSDPLPKAVGGGSNTPTNYGVALGYAAPGDMLGWDIGAAYLYNMIAANSVAFQVVNMEGGNFYRSRVGGVAAYFDINSGPFAVSVRYSSAVQTFNVFDLPKNGVGSLTGMTITGAPIAGAGGARPWAAGIQAGYGFEVWSKAQNIYLGYQATNQASGLNLPKNRWTAGYGINMWKNTDFALQWDHDQAYSITHGGIGKNTNLVTIRAAVEYS